MMFLNFVQKFIVENMVKGRKHLSANGSNKKSCQTYPVLPTSSFTRKASMRYDELIET
jgi:hypothetical protein